MQTTTEPPYVPIRRSGWPTKRSPRWACAAGAGLLLIAVLVGLSRRPTNGQRAADLRGLLSTLNTDIESCSGGVGDALRVLNAIDSGSSHDVATAIKLATLGAANSSPANTQLLHDTTARSRARP